MKKTFILLACLLFWQTKNVWAQHYRTQVANNDIDSVTQQLLIPNAFTPNHDGKNDEFKITNFSNQKLIEFKIFNRWGTILFQTHDPQKGWDGTFKGKEQAVGVYGYVIRIAYPDNVVETYKGTVTLIR